MREPLTTTIRAGSVDDLVRKAVAHVRTHGRLVTPRAGRALEAYSVSYVLTNPYDRLHNLRAPVAIRYFARELLAFFRGSLNVEDGLAQASSKWRQVANEAGRVNSNYGYYVFHQMISGRTQYEWALHHLLNRPGTRRAVININQPCHRRELDTKDFPCAIAAQLFERDGKLCAEVSYRSVDVLLGLPYDMGFFAFVTELAWRDLLEMSAGSLDLTLSYTMLKTSFTQIYEETAHLADTVLRTAKESGRRRELMPRIESASAVVRDIRFGTAESTIVRWLQERAKSNEIMVEE